MTSSHHALAVDDPAALGFDPARLQRVLAAIELDIERGACDGAEIVVGRGGRVALHARRGYADRAGNRPLGPDAVYASMSLGKQFVNVLVLACVERGLLRLHAPVADVLPGFGMRGKERVTVAQLLTHTSGVVSAIPSLPVEDLVSIERLTRYAASTAPEFLPGSRVSYSVLAAHAVLASLVLAVDGRGRRFAQVLEDDLFRPLGMRDTSLGRRDDLYARLCPVVARYREPGLFDPQAIEGFGQTLGIPGAEAPAGGYLTTASDIHRFAGMLRGRGALDGARILAPATIDLASRSHTGDAPNAMWDYAVAARGWQPWPASVGLGPFVRGEAPAPGFFGALNSPRSFGAFGAGSTCFWVDPAHDVTFTFLSTGLMEDSRHIERLGRLSDIVLAALTAP